MWYPQEYLGKGLKENFISLAYRQPIRDLYKKQGRVEVYIYCWEFKFSLIPIRIGRMFKA
jgi:hypothetical protein